MTIEELKNGFKDNRTWDEYGRTIISYQNACNLIDTAVQSERERIIEIIDSKMQNYKAIKEGAEFLASDFERDAAHTKHYALLSLKNTLLSTPQQEVCKWVEDDDGIYHTDCGHECYFNDGPIPKSNKYCTYCSKPIEVISTPQQEYCEWVFTEGAGNPEYETSCGKFFSVDYYVAHEMGTFPCGKPIKAKESDNA